MDAIHKDQPVARPRVTLEIDVANHPGVMSHIVGFFARRLFNLEGVVCLPVGDGRSSRVWLWVNEDPRLPQMILQLQKLEDVRRVIRTATPLPAAPAPPSPHVRQP
jgi:acetolactate synthase-1/3 small subunit